MLLYPVNQLAYQLGITLIELLLTLTLNLFLLSVMISMYLTSEHSHRLQLALNKIQENAYVTIHILNQEIRRAGYIGCAKLTEDFPIISSGRLSLNSKNALIVNANELIVRHASVSYALLNKMTKDLSILYVNKELMFTQGDWIVISNCQRGEIAQIKGINKTALQQKLILSQPLHFNFTPYAEVSKLELNRFFIANTQRRNKDGSRISALFLENIHQQKIELVENISELKFQLSSIGFSFDFEVSSFPFKKHWYSYVALLI